MQADHPREDDAEGLEETKDVPEAGEGSEVDVVDSSEEGIMDLIDQIEAAGRNEKELLTVLRKIGRRIRVDPSERDLLSDFEGISQICALLSEPQYQWRGAVMLAWCSIIPEVCRTSAINRVSLREGGFISALVEFLRESIVSGNELEAAAACTALCAVCTANDPNKKAAAQFVRPPSKQVGEPALDAPLTVDNNSGKPGAMQLLFDALASFEDSEPVQTEGISALRALITDDDFRKASVESSALLNRTMATSDEGIPFFAIVVMRGLDLADRVADKKPIKLLEQSLLLLRELARRVDLVEHLAIGTCLLPKVQALLKSDSPRVVRASLGVLRAFVINDVVRDEVALLTDGVDESLFAVSKHLSTPAVAEQGFGFFANLTMRKSTIAAKLNDRTNGVVALALLALRLHRERPQIVQQVVHTLRNVASQEESAAKECKETDIFEEVRRVVKERDEDKRFEKAVDISRQFLREQRMDAGLLKAAQYNKYY